MSGVVIEVFHAKWLICGGVERQRYVYVLAVL